MPGCGHTRNYGHRVPNSPRTPKHGVRVPDERWEAAMRVAKDRGETLTDVINRALERYVREHPMPDDPPMRAGE